MTRATASCPAPGARGRLRRALAALSTAALVAATLTLAGVLSPAPASAAGALATGFSAGDIISDATFYDANAMSAASIQSFLTAQVPTCRGTSVPCLRDYTQTTPTRPATAYCSQYQGVSGESAASILARVGQACGINPQVLLVTLQKENGLVTSTAPSAGGYQTAMGFGCPDTAACDSTYFGFFNQVYSAASQFQRYTKNPTYFSYQAGRTSNILYNPSSSCGSASVTIENQATANLYNYTPYTPNAATLAVPLGVTAPCGAYGNKNFFIYFTQWFGNPANLLRSPSFEASGTGWGFNSTVNRQLVKSPGQAQDGAYFLATNTPTAGLGVAQTTSTPTSFGQQVTASIWLRSANVKTFTGSVSLSASGGSTETSSVPFAVGPTWTKVTATLPVQASHTGLRLGVAMTTPSSVSSLWVDDSSMSVGAAPVLQNRLRSPGFESAFAGWGTVGGSINRSVARDGRAHDGSYFAAANTAAVGRGLSQTVSAATSPNQRWTFSIWLRSSDSRPFTGSLALTTLGGATTATSTTPFSATGAWQRFTTTVDVGSTGATSLRADVLMSTTQSTGPTLWLDTASVSPNLLASGSFEGGATTGWAADPGVALTPAQATTAVPAATGAWYATTSTPTAGASITQTISPLPQQTTYTAELWVRSQTPGRPFTGRLAVWIQGGATGSVSATQRFTTQDAWTLIRFPVPVSAPDRTSLKLQIYEDTPGVGLALDGAQIY